MPLLLLRYSLDMPEYTVDQVFLQLRGGRLELLLVLENFAGARHRETLTFPTRNSVEAVTRAAKHLAHRGDITSVKGARLRREQRGELKDDASLQRMFINEFARHHEEDA